MAAPKTVADLAQNVVTENKATEATKVLENLAQAAESAERYDDMVVIMQKLVAIAIKAKEPLSGDQRNLLSVAYKNVVGAKRSSWRILSDDQVSVQSEGKDIDKALVTKYREIVETELQDICNKVLSELNTLQEQNEPRMSKVSEADKANESKTKPQECQVFYLKMIGDYYRYLTEAFSDNVEYKASCKDFYEKAMKLAAKELEATHPTRLGLALNFSVCYYEILEKPAKACELAKSAFDEAIEKLDSLNDVSYKDSTLIMQLLRDNLTIWNQGKEADEPVAS